MPWEEELFAALEDLEQQAEALYDTERSIDLADRSRAEYQQVTLAGRLMASVGSEVVLDVVGVGALTGLLRRVADGWLLLRGPAQDWVVPQDAMVAVRGASPRAVPEVAWPVTAKLGLGSALRRLADTGQPCVVHTRDGGRYEGVPTRVGRDFLEVVSGSRTLLVSWAALAAVRSDD